MYIPRILERRKIRIGGTTLAPTLTSKEVHVNSGARRFLDSSLLIVEYEVREIWMFFIRPMHLGYEDLDQSRWPTTTELFAEERLEEWNSRLEEPLAGFTLARLPHEALARAVVQHGEALAEGTQYFAYSDFLDMGWPTSEVDSEVRSSFLCYGRNWQGVQSDKSQGKPWLMAKWTKPGSKWCPGEPLVFQGIPPA